MIVLGADTHKRSHTVAGVAAPTGELLGEQTVPVDRGGFGALLQWARGLDDERVWALEDCRHVSGSLERFLIERGERVLRIPTHLTGEGSQERPPARQVRPDRRPQRGPRRAAGGPGVLPGRAPGWARAGSAAARRPPRAACPPPRRAQQHVALAAARPVARATAARRRAVLKEMEHANRTAAGPRRADDARADRARRAAPPARTHARDQPTRARDHRTRAAARAATPRRARVRAADRRQARR
jgi:hypothetical protein